jgi:AcrR family transcriptional regulator
MINGEALHFQAPMSKIGPNVNKKPRADAQRNREHILEIAKESFATDGAGVTLDEIAKRANVGPGTLYRHFPTREALLEAVYRTEVEKLASAEKEFALKMAPVPALRAWMLLFVDYLATKKVIAPALSIYLCGDTNVLFESTGNQIKSAIQSLVDRAIKSGDIREDLDPIDLLRAIYGVASVATDSDWQQNAKRLVEILLLGSRPSA